MVFKWFFFILKNSIPVEKKYENIFLFLFMGSQNFLDFFSLKLTVTDKGL